MSYFMMGQKLLSSLLVVLFALPQSAFGEVDLATKEKAVMQAYKMVSISFASTEFNDVQREQYLQAFKSAVSKNEVTREELEKIAVTNKWVPENFDFSEIWNFVKGIGQKEITKADGSYDLKALEKLAAKGKQLFSGQTGNQYGDFELGGNASIVLTVLFICAGVVVIVANT